MAVVPINPTDISRSGTVDTLAAANADGYLVKNLNDRTWIEVLNSAGGSMNVILTQANANVDGGTAPTKTIAVAAGVRKKIGHFIRKIYNNGADQVLVTFSSATDVTFGAWSLPLE